MSLVGTRPPTQEEVRLYEARHRMRLATKSCYAQVHLEACYLGSGS